MEFGRELAMLIEPFESMEIKSYNTAKSFSDAFYIGLFTAVAPGKVRQDVVTFERSKWLTS